MLNSYFLKLFETFPDMMARWLRYDARNDNNLADTIVHRNNDMLNENGSVRGEVNLHRVFSRKFTKELAI